MAQFVVTEAKSFTFGFDEDGVSLAANLPNGDFAAIDLSVVDGELSVVRSDFDLMDEFQAFLTALLGDAR